MKSLYFTLGAVLAAGAALAHEGAPQGPGKVMFLEFPADPARYTPPVAALLEDGVVARYGLEEFAAVVLTNELHQHIGIYTVLGAKMGVRAREVLQAPSRAVHARMDTTRRQPVACALDGIQMALGSTFGQNLIEAPDRDEPRVAGAFTWRDRRVRLALKPEFAARLWEMILQARERHGDLTPGYFNEIEERSYEVWREWDRVEIFELEMTRLDTPETAE
jgi:pyrimidine-specific ribonucleoside hydrolase